MKFVFNDGGRSAAGYKGRTGDCVARAIAIAAQLPYEQVYAALAAGTASERRSKRGGRLSGQRTARNGIHVGRRWFKEYMAALGFTWVPTMQIGSGCKVHLADGELPMGRLVVSVSKHYTAVIDGVIQDTHNPSDRGVTIYSPSWPDIPKGAQRLPGTDQWVYAPKRCVYGYWLRSSAVDSHS